MCNEYAYELAKALVWPELTVEFAADVINGNVYGSEIWDEVCTLTGGWCDDTNVFLAWDKMGRPDELNYLDPDYDSERDPARRRAMGLIPAWAGKTKGGTTLHYRERGLEVCARHRN